MIKYILYIKHYNQMYSMYKTLKLDVFFIQNIIIKFIQCMKHYDKMYSIYKTL